jgi:hypothetical protein
MSIEIELADKQFNVIELDDKYKGYDIKFLEHYDEKNVIKNLIIMLNKISKYYTFTIDYDPLYGAYDTKNKIEYLTNSNINVYSTFNSRNYSISEGTKICISGILEMNNVQLFYKIISLAKDKYYNHKVTKTLKINDLYNYLSLNLKYGGDGDINVIKTDNVEKFKDYIYDQLYKVEYFDIRELYMIENDIYSITNDSYLENINDSFMENNKLSENNYINNFLGYLDKKYKENITIKFANYVKGDIYINNKDLTHLFNTFSKDTKHYLSNLTVDDLIYSENYIKLDEYLICPHYITKYKGLQGLVGKFIKNKQDNKYYCRICDNIIYETLKLTESKNDEFINSKDDETFKLIRFICNYIIDYNNMMDKIVINYVYKNVLDVLDVKNEYYIVLFTIGIIVNIVKKKIFLIDFKKEYKLSSIERFANLCELYSKTYVNENKIPKEQIINDVKSAIIKFSKYNYVSNVENNKEMEEYDSIMNITRYYLFDLIYSLLNYSNNNISKLSYKEILKSIFNLNEKTKTLLNDNVLKKISSIKNDKILSEIYDIFLLENNINHTSELDLFLNKIKNKRKHYDSMNIYKVPSFESIFKEFKIDNKLLYNIYCLDGKKHSFKINIFKFEKKELEMTTNNFLKLKIEERNQYKYINNKCELCNYINDSFSNIKEIKEEDLIININNRTINYDINCPKGGLHYYEQNICKKCKHVKGKKNDITLEKKTVLLGNIIYDKNIEFITGNESGKKTEINSNYINNLIDKIKDKTSYFYNKLNVSDIIYIFPLIGNLKKIKYEDVIKEKITKKDINIHLQYYELTKYVLLIIQTISYIYNTPDNRKYNKNFIVNENDYKLIIELRKILDVSDIDNNNIINNILHTLIKLNDDKICKYIIECILYNEYIRSKSLELYKIKDIKLMLESESLANEEAD